MIGTRLGPYEITAKLGEGGMGEVYRATDTKLEREVAVKVLPAAFIEDPDRLARFEREAKLLAQLHHTNIASIFGLEESEGTRALVMELVEGPTLADRLESGSLSLTESFSIARQIAEALETAHEKGIVHRDLKPQNIKASMGGKVKVLDFGLAKAMDVGSGVSSVQDLARSPTIMNSPTLTVAGTQLGVILGTAAYMSPEQARGQGVDKRADIWAFGVVLYEMLTGRSLFSAETVSDTLAAVLTREPDWQALSASVGPALRRLLARCLEKSARRRYRDIGDVAADLDAAVAIDAEREASAAGAGGVAAPRRARVAGVVAAAAVLLAAALGFLLWRDRHVAPEPYRYRQLTFLQQYVSNARYAPDGETVVFSAALEGNDAGLFVRRPEDPQAQPLSERDVHLLAVSSRGELAVLTRARFLYHRTYVGTLARMPLATASPRELLEEVTTADWSPDGSELAVVRQAEGRSRLEYPIGKVLAQSAGYLSDLRISPSGDRIAYMEHALPQDNRGRVLIVDLEGREIARSPSSWGEEGLAWSADGESVVFTAAYERESYTVWSMSLDGSVRELLQDSANLIVYDLAKDGRLLVSTDEGEVRLLARFAGEPAERELRWLGASYATAMAADGKTLLFCDQSDLAGINYAVYLQRAGGVPPLRLGEGWPLDLSPDGKFVLASVPSDPPRLFLYPTGAGEPREITIADFTAYGTGSFFPDGRSVLLCGAQGDQARRCFVRDLESGDIRAVTPDGTEGGLLLAGGGAVLAMRTDGSWARFPLEGGAEETIAGLDDRDQLVRVGADGKSVLVVRPTEVPTAIERLDLATGERSLVRELAPPDLLGALRFWWVGVSADESAYAYDYTRALGQIFEIEGLK